MEKKPSRKMEKMVKIKYRETRGGTGGRSSKFEKRMEQMRVREEDSRSSAELRFVYSRKNERGDGDALYKSKDYKGANTSGNAYASVYVGGRIRDSVCIDL